MNESSSKEKPPLLLNGRQAAELCGCSDRTWRTRHASGLIPLPVRVGKALFWRKREIVAWVEAGCPDRETWVNHHT